MSTGFYFGPENRALLGHLHLPSEASDAALGVVICNPFGFEEVSAHRSLRHLAETLAHSGIPALRFDYWGCGNSAGDDGSVEGLQTWTDSIAQAIRALQEHAGVEKVVLIGLRLGALLATLAANEQKSVAGIVAIAPVVQGRKYLREMRALAQASTTLSPTDLPDDGSLEVTGFPLNASTVAALQAIDLSQLPLQYGPRVLILERDDLPSNGQWLAALTAQGLVASSQIQPGYAGMMEDPQRVTVPLAMWSAIAREVSDWRVQCAAAGPMRSFTPPAPSSYTAPNYKERCLFMPVQDNSAPAVGAPGEALFGVLTVPVQQPCSRVVICLNSGAVHLMGPNRLWVRIAREWAARGVAVLRLDFSGIGDSPVRQGCAENMVYSVPALDEVAQVVDYVRQTLGTSEVHLLGLCSGAYHAFKAMASGVPVQSAVIINPLTYFWEPGRPAEDGIKDYELVAHSEKYSRQLFTLAPWKKLFSGQLDLRYLLGFMARKLGGIGIRIVGKVASRLHISIGDDLNKELVAAGKRGGIQKFIFARGEPGLVLLLQHGEMSLQKMQESGQLRIRLVEDADHTFTRGAARDRLMLALNACMFE